MIESFTIKNMENNTSLLFDMLGTDGYVIDEVDWGTIKMTRSETMLYGQFGTTFLDELAEKRTITIKGYVIAKQEKNISDWTAYYADKLAQINTEKIALRNVCSPLCTLRIIIGDYFIEGRMQESVKYSSKDYQNNDVLCYFQIVLHCSDPTFRKTIVLTDVVGSSSSPYSFTYDSEIPTALRLTFKNTSDIKSALSAGTGNQFILQRRMKVGNTWSYYTTGQITFSAFSTGSSSSNYVLIDTNTGNLCVNEMNSSNVLYKSLLPYVSFSGDNYRYIRKGINRIGMKIANTYNTYPYTLEYDERYTELEGM